MCVSSIKLKTHFFAEAYECWKWKMDNLMLKIMSYLKENQVCNFAKPIHKYLAKIHLKRLFCEHSYPSMSKRKLVLSKLSCSKLVWSTFSMSSMIVAYVKIFLFMKTPVIVFQLRNSFIQSHAYKSRTKRT